MRCAIEIDPRSVAEMTRSGQILRICGSCGLSTMDISVFYVVGQRGGTVVATPWDERRLKEGVEPCLIANMW